ncbi:ABC transporter substrate-binding protein [Vannielia litorea]|uniref:ABC transporter substrate-binding protein n=1 Tax=Vannielia litorea TaxID=1217970 RepID=UPI001C93DB70|nr:ABC transporter substrate-binding protein [Vannielia litorea]MBY6047228.1 ABC transporter substrate-binding protein [Vannielia litorea]MBY6074642.1 ABC transporter substrate-binding protein [Vannielia litorea]MBY6152839.1 ABC transporter substrate-binding protein [Vannielia litorea]
MKSLRTLALAGAAALVSAAGAIAQDLPQIRFATLKIGTVNWELETIKANGFDKAHGFELVMQPYADNGATRVALEGGEADVAVADWIWVARQRAAGKDYVVIPYSKAVGGLVVPEGSEVQSLQDLKGKKVGIAGGPLDKSWLILRAYAEQEYGMDLKAETEQVFGAPPLIFKSGLSGETDGAINFWHFLAKMKAAGMREVISVEQASSALGLDPETPLLGYVMKESFLADNPDLGHALYRASRDAKALLAEDDAAWEAVRPMMNAQNDAQFETLKADFRAGIPGDAPVSEEGADALLKVMARLGGADLVGDATELPKGLFLTSE